MALRRDAPDRRQIDLLVSGDKLGPLTRAVVAESPNDMDVGDMIQAAPIVYRPRDDLLALWLARYIRRRYPYAKLDDMTERLRSMGDIDGKAAVLDVIEPVSPNAGRLAAFRARHAQPISGRRRG